MAIRIRYANGRNETTETLTEALDRLRDEYPDAVVYDDWGWQVEGEDDETVDDLRAREGARCCVWETEGDSCNDDGGRAVASLEWTD